MPTILGRNRNTNADAVVASYILNDADAIEIAPANPDRMCFEVHLDPGTLDVDAFIRLYDATIDNVKAGSVITRRLAGNDALFTSFWRMSPDNIYTGPISAISALGLVTVHVIEY